jgi:hypothetical protein
MGDLFILIVSEDANFRDYIGNHLLMDGHYVDTVYESNIARQMLHRIKYDLVLLSVSDCSPESDLLTAEEIKKINPNSEVIFLFNPNCTFDKQGKLGREMQNCLLNPFLLENLPLVLEKVQKAKAKRKGVSCPIAIKSYPIKERRKHNRVPADIPIKYTIVSPLGNLPSEENVSKLINMSQEGVMFRADFRAKLSEYVYLHILLPTSTTPVNIEGEIRWERFIRTEPWRYVGVCFSNLNHVSRKQIDSFIGSRQG